MDKKTFLENLRQDKYKTFYALAKDLEAVLSEYGENVFKKARETKSGFDAKQLVTYKYEKFHDL